MYAGDDCGCGGGERDGGGAARGADAAGGGLRQPPAQFQECRPSRSLLQQHQGKDP